MDDAEDLLAEVEDLLSDIDEQEAEQSSEANTGPRTRPPRTRPPRPPRTRPPRTTTTIPEPEDSCNDLETKYKNCTSEQRCKKSDGCKCFGGYYRETETLKCAQFVCQGALELYCENITSPFTDHCDYAAGDSCENQCIISLDQCSCGGELFNIRDSQSFCCNGKQQSINQPCTSSNAPSCYNSYQDSEYIGYSSHFSCPDVCVPILDMCQGISWCPEDVEVCDENLRIPRAIKLKDKYTYYNLTIKAEKLSISKAANHHYYIHNADGKVNDRKYDVFDRSDEQKIKADIDNSLDVDVSKLEFCFDSGNTTGIQCDRCLSKPEFCNGRGSSCDNIDFRAEYHPLCTDKFDESNVEDFKKRLNSTILEEFKLPRQIELEFCSNSEVSLGVLCEKCVPRSDWCNGSPSSCGSINTDNDAICSNFTLWKNSSCDVQNGAYLGASCRGNPGECYYPWYARYDGYVAPYCASGGLCNPLILSHECSDKSDQVFPLNQTCRTLAHYLYNFYGPMYCQGQWSEFCERLRDIEKAKVELSEIPAQPYYDPHHCWDSCAEPGESCLACTNPNYFNCTKSRVCIHPDLRCDGHPHCEDAEDEDLDMCKDKYLERGVIKARATYICQSLMYPAMKTIATACDDVVECEGKADESSCSTIVSSYTVIAVTLIGVTSLYLGLKVSRIIYYKIKGNNDKESPELDLDNLTKYRHILTKYQNNHEDPDTIEMMNVYLLYVINSRERDAAKEICTKFYDIEERACSGNENKIFHRFHTMFEPMVVTDVVDAKFPGITQCLVDGLEGCFNSRFITNCQNNL